MLCRKHNFPLFIKASSLIQALNSRFFAKNYSIVIYFNDLVKTLVLNDNKSRQYAFSNKGLAMRLSLLRLKKDVPL